MKKLLSATLFGASSHEVACESTFTKGLPGFAIVGLVSHEISEAKERVKSALIFCGFEFPPLKITVNLAPSDLNKSGTHFDLPIALSIALQEEEIDFSNWYIFGEMGLDGSIKATSHLFAIVLSLVEQKETIKVMVPKESLEKLSVIPHVQLVGVANLEEAMVFFKEGKEQFYEAPESLPYKHVEIHAQKYYYEPSFALDFADVKGQGIAKRAALLAAAGMHNILFEGNPGCGKSMIIKRLASILPPMSLSEILEVANYKALDKQEIAFAPQRPYRNCHHSSTKASIMGGGSANARIGEVALAHQGILFFDELPHFQKSVLEALREPLEDKKVLISRVNAKVEYKTDFMFCAAQNPCPCGNLLSKRLECRCSEVEVARYKNRLSEPFLDRIDLYVQMQEVSHHDKTDISSETLFKQVLFAFSKQKERKQPVLNAKLDERGIKMFCKQSSESETVLHMAIERFSLSQRSINKVLKTARTIADLEGCEQIEKNHMLEALSYRKRT